MLEWLKRHAWKACKRQKRFPGSNPGLSAKILQNPLKISGFFFSIPVVPKQLRISFLPYCELLFLPMPLISAQRKGCFCSAEAKLLLSGKSASAQWKESPYPIIALKPSIT